MKENEVHLTTRQQSDDEGKVEESPYVGELVSRIYSSSMSILPISLALVFFQI